MMGKVVLGRVKQIDLAKVSHQMVAVFWFVDYRKIQVALQKLMVEIVIA